MIVRELMMVALRLVDLLPQRRSRRHPTDTASDGEIRTPALSPALEQEILDVLAVVARRDVDQLRPLYVSEVVEESVLRTLSFYDSLRAPRADEPWLLEYFPQEDGLPGEVAARLMEGASTSDVVVHLELTPTGVRVADART